MKHSVTLLGTSSAMPSRGRFPSSQLIEFSDWTGLIDCGEGTQIQMSKYRIKRNKISHIFISHLHGDHVFGLPGLLGSYNHFNRLEKLTIFGPPGIKKLIQTVEEVSGAHYNYPIIIHELPHNVPGKIDINDNVTVQYFPLKHRVPTIGYRFDYHLHKINIRKESIDQYNLSIDQIKDIKNGNDIYLQSGEKLLWKSVTTEETINKSYSYCSDTIFDPEIISFIKGTDFLYHETTYLDGMEEEASIRKHATLGQAIEIARMAKVHHLITGHYSSRYATLEVFHEVARSNELDIIVGVEGMKISI